MELRLTSTLKQLYFWWFIAIADLGNSYHQSIRGSQACLVIAYLNRLLIIYYDLVPYSIVS